MAISIALCGLVRDRERLSEKLAQWRRWREGGQVDRIAYATWIGEVDRFEGLRAELEAAGVDLVEIDEPRLVLKGGHQLHQMTALHYALALIPDANQFVLKTRVDLASNDPDMPRIFAAGTPPADDVLGLGLQNKILIEYAQMIYPFLCGDSQFFGRKRDLVRLINMSNEMEMLLCRLAVEQTYFFEPFKDSALFGRHFYWNLPHISEIKANRAGQTEELMRTPEILDAIKGWWIVLQSYFKVGWGDAAAAPLINDLPGAFAFDVAAVKKIGGDGSDLMVNDGFVQALNRLIEPGERTRLLAAMRARDNPLDVPDPIFTAYENFRAKLSDLPSPRAARAGDSRRVIWGPQHFFVKADDDASRRYHAEVTHLRRELCRVNDLLMAKGHFTLRGALHYGLRRVLPPPVKRILQNRLPRLNDKYLRFLSGGSET